VPAAPAQQQPAEKRDVVEGGNRGRAVRTARARADKIEHRRVGSDWRGLGVVQRSAFGPPRAFHHQGQAVDDDVKETADQQAEQAQRGNEGGW